MNIEAVFVKSAAGLADFPTDGLPEIALVGRSNVGKSSLVNALARRRVARTSAAPGKTRLANLYHVVRGTNAPFYLVDLPGYGYARGGSNAAREFGELIVAYFGRAGRVGQGTIAALLLADARHPGLQSDVEARQWLLATVERVAVVVTKIDKLARGQRIRAMRELESAFEHPVLPVSATTGEGLEDLWKLIDKLANNRNSSSPCSPRRRRAQRATAPHSPKNSSGSISRRSRT